MSDNNKAFALVHAAAALKEFEDSMREAAPQLVLDNLLGNAMHYVAIAAEQILDEARE